MIDSIKNTVGSKLKMNEIELKKLTRHLLEMNKGVSFESEFKVMKVLVLIDCTCSMGNTL